MMELSEAARSLLEQMATHEFADVALPPSCVTPSPVAELIMQHAITFPDGGPPRVLRCQITKAGLDLYRKSYARS